MDSHLLPLRILPLLLLSLSVSAIRVNCGGGALQNGAIVADDKVYYARSTSYVFKFLNKPNESVPESVYSSHSWCGHNGDLIYNIPIPTNYVSYKVTLRFAENFAGLFRVGARIFDVYIDSNLVESNVDVFGKAGGGFKGYDITYNSSQNTTKNSTGTARFVTVRINPKAENAFISGIDVDAIAVQETNTTSATPASTSPDQRSQNAPVAVSASSSSSTSPSSSATPSSTVSASAAAAALSPSPTTVAQTRERRTILLNMNTPTVSPSHSLTTPSVTATVSTAIPIAAGSPSDTNSPSPTSTASAVTASPSTTLSSSPAPSPSSTISTGPIAQRVAGAATDITVTPSVSPSATLSLSATPSATLSTSPTSSATASASASTAASTTPSSSPSVSAAARAPVSIVKINAGGPDLDGYKADDKSYSGTTSSDVFSYTNKESPAVPTTVYSTHAWASDMADLIYRIPVTTAGTVDVIVGFAENFRGNGRAGARVFDVFINGQLMQSGVDVYTKTDGKLFLPYEVRASNLAIPDGAVTVRIAPKVENAFVSAIEILQMRAAPTPAGPQTPTSCIGRSNGNSVATDFNNKFHLSHAVSGGPYVDTDFDGDGGALVALDASGSHSHATDPAVGRIVEYRWTWADAGNAMQVNGTVVANGARVSSVFPLGTTKITLEVADQYCNLAQETTTVTVNPSTRKGAYCYTYDFGDSMPEQVPLPKSAAGLPRPQYGTNAGSINFDSAAAFGEFPFRVNSFAVRCTFSENATDTSTSRRFIHSGPLMVYCDNALVVSSNSSQPQTLTVSSPRSLSPGVHQWQVLYFRPKNLAPLLILQDANGTLVSEQVVRHDGAKVLPVITQVSRTSALPGEIVTVVGTAFVNGAQVKFGNRTASPVISTATSIQVRVPTPTRSLEVLQITVETGSGVSNGITFMYAMMSVPCQAVLFSETSLKTADGSADYKISDIAVIRYGPDGRLYLGSQRDLIHVLTINKNLAVTKSCTKSVRGPGARRWILGLEFNPKSTALKLYFSTNTFNWRKFNLIQDFAEGWTNGKVESITVNDANSCFNDDVQTVVSGLPVTNHDHGINFLQFIPDGRLLISVGGFTNRGISVVDDALGGIPPNPYSAAIITCPISGTARITYSDINNPLNTTVTGGNCQMYAAGLRNAYAAEYHTNGELYVTDNGGNQGFGDVSTDCFGRREPAENEPDMLIKVEQGRCHGHPNLSRGIAGNTDECTPENANCVQPLISSLRSSTNGVVEYRSNLFGGRIKGDLFLTLFSDTAGKRGRITRVQLNEQGALQQNGVTTIFQDNSGLSVVEGPRGEMIMSRVFKDSFLVLQPVCAEKHLVTYLIGVLPRRGPASGGHKVEIHGYNFGRNPTAMFGPNSCTNIQVIDDDAFSCITPPGIANMQVKVTVTGTTGENIPHEGTDYWYW